MKRCMKHVRQHQRISSRNIKPVQHINTQQQQFDEHHTQQQQQKTSVKHIHIE